MSDQYWRTGIDGQLNQVHGLPSVATERATIAIFYEQAPAAPIEAKPMTQTKEDAGVPTEKSASAQESTVDLGKGIRFGYDRGLYTQFKDKFQLKIRARGRDADAAS